MMVGSVSRKITVLEKNVESLALLVAMILLTEILVAVFAICLSFTNFKYLSVGFSVLSIAIGFFMIFTTPQILLPTINLIAGVFGLINFLRK